MAKKLANFDSGKHPRGSHGRFTSTPDHTKLSSSQLGKARVHGADSDERKLVLSRLNPAQKTRLFHTSLAKDPEVLAAFNRLTPRQQSRLLQAFHNGEVSFSNTYINKHRSAATGTTTATHHSSLTPEQIHIANEPYRLTAIASTNADWVAPGAAPLTSVPDTSYTHRLRKLNKAADDKSLKVDTTGRIAIWTGTKHANHTGDFEVHDNPGFRHEVSVDGQTFTLNTHTKQFKFQGEAVNGVPDFVPPEVRRSMSSTELFQHLAYTMSRAEYSDQGKQPPMWNPDWYGRVHDERYVISNKIHGNGGDGKYGVMQVHHVQQWAKESFLKINEDFVSGRITLLEAKESYRSLLIASTESSKGYKIGIQDQNERTFVVLPGGLHDTNSPLYIGSHPLGIHPDLGEAMPFGIPVAAEGGRDWFNKWRPKFWREYYRHNSHLLVEELNDRMRKGELDPAEVQNHWQTALNGVK